MNVSNLTMMNIEKSDKMSKQLTRLEEKIIENEKKINLDSTTYSWSYKFSI
jgi:hypothetical protein